MESKILALISSLKHENEAIQQEASQKLNNIINQETLSPEILKGLIDGLKRNKISFSFITKQSETASIENKDLLENTTADLDKTRLGKETTETRLAPSLSQHENEDKSTYKTTAKIKSPHREERYKHLKLLGAGGMGVVQLVQDQVLGREVALKKLNIKSKSPSPITSKKQKMLLWRLQREASITATLEHPNIVPLYDLEEKANGEFYFTMRKIGGATLHQILKNKATGKKDYNERKLLSIFLKICDAIAYSHSQQVIHRDLKPENIMVGEFGEVYVMDWGIAKQHGQQDFAEEKNEQIETKVTSQWKTIGGIGTPGYMPLEQSKDASAVDFRADIYALGKILRECYTLLSPLGEFRYILEQQKKENQNQEKRQALFFKEQIEKKIPLDIQAIIQKAAHEKQEDRYQTILEMATDVERYLIHAQVSARDYKLTEILNKWFLRNRSKVLTASVVICMAVLLFSYFIWDKKREKDIRFQQSIKTAQTLYKKTATEQEKNIVSQNLLDALNALNIALNTFPGNKQAEQEKFKIASKLIQNSLALEDYQVASYVAKDIQEIQLISKETKAALSKQVEQARTKTYRDHLARLNYWLSALKEPQEGMKEIALLEISKMPEEEIFLKIAKLVEQGTQEFLAGKLSLKEREYYGVLVSALGWLKNTKAKKVLLPALIKMSEKVQLKIKKEKYSSIDEIEYMTQIAKALAHIKAPQTAKIVNEIREKLGEDNLFWDQTELAYRSLAQYEKLEQEDVSDVKGYTQRGRLRQNLGHGQDALADYQQALKLLNTLQEKETNKQEKAELLQQKAKIYGLIGDTKREKQDYEGALIAYNKAIELDPKFLKAYLYRGLAKHKRNLLKEAIIDYSLVIKRNPLNSEAYNYRGLAFYEQRESKKAIKDFTKALEFAPQNAALYSSRGAVKNAFGDYDGALQDFNQALALNRNFKLAYVNRSIVFQNRGDFQSALRDQNKIISLDPRNVMAYSTRGILRKELKDFEGAFADFKEALRLQPNHARAYLERGKLKIELKKYQEAKQDFEKVLSLGEWEYKSYAHRWLSNINFTEGELTKALEHINEALTLNPKLVNGYFVRATIYSKLRQWSQAAKDLKKLIELEPSKGLAYKELGDIYLGRIYQPRRALEYFNKAIELKTDGIYDAYLKRGMVFEELKKPELALKDYNQAIKINSNLNSAIFNRAILREAMLDFNGALEDINKVIKMTPKFDEAYFMRGHILFSSGQIEASFGDFIQALELNPNHLKANYMKGTVLSQKQQYKEAIQQYQKVIRLDKTFLLAYQNLAAAQTKLRDNHGAIQTYTQAILLFPAVSDLYRCRALPKLNLKDIKSALADTQKAVSLDPKNSNAFHLMADCYSKLGEIEKALEAYETHFAIRGFSSVFKTYSKFLIQLSISSYRKKEWEKAQNYLQRLIKNSPPNHPEKEKWKKMLQQISSKK